MKVVTIKENERFIIYPEWDDYKTIWVVERQEYVNLGFFRPKWVWKTKVDVLQHPFEGTMCFPQISYFDSRAKAIASANKVRKEYLKFLSYKED